MTIMLYPDASVKALQEVYDESVDEHTEFHTLRQTQSVLRRLEIAHLADEWNTTPEEIDKLIDGVLYENYDKSGFHEEYELYDKVCERLKQEASSIKYDNIRHNYIRYGVLSGGFVLHIGGTPPKQKSMVRAAYITPAGVDTTGAPNWLATLVIERNLYEYDDAVTTCYRQEWHDNIDTAHQWVANRIDEYDHIPLVFNDFSAGVSVTPIRSDVPIDIPIRPLNTERVPAALKRQYKRQYKEELTGEHFNQFTDIELVRPDKTQSVIYDVNLGEYLSLLPYNNGYTVPRPGCIELSSGEGGEWLTKKEVQERTNEGRYTSPSTL